MFKFWCAVLAVFCPALLHAQTNILFVGNSFTHGHYSPVVTYNNSQITDANGSGYGGVPGIFKKFATQAGYPCNVTIEAVSGQTLAYHLANKSAIIGDPKWNVVVLQELSTGPLPTAHGGDPASFQSSADALQDLVLSNNPAAKVLLYETWTSPASAADQGYNGVLQAMQDDLQSAYYHLKYRAIRASGKPDYAAVGRVGDSFMRAVDQGYADPDPSDGISPGTFYLWGADNRHPSAYGAYLSAAVFFGKLTGLDPRTLSSGTGSAAADLGISAADGQTLQRLAYEINALAEPAPIPPPAANVNTVLAGTNLNWNAAATWSAGSLVATNALLVNAASADVSQVANSLSGGTRPTGVQTLSFDIAATTKNVQPNLTTQNPRTMTLTGGTDALGGTDLVHLSSATTGTANVGTNSGFSTVTITLGTDGSFNVENATGTLNFGASSILAGNVSLAKNGAGKMSLAGANTFGAGTGNQLTISAGTLLANTSVSGTASATGAAGVLVSAGGTLGGTGQIVPGSGKGITVASGGTLAPGTTGIGTLTLNGANTTSAVLSLNAGALLNFELNSSGAGDFQADRVTLLNGAANDLVFNGATINLTDLASGGLPAGAYTLFSAAGASNYAGLAMDGSGNVTAGLSLGGGLDDYSASLQLSGANLVLKLAPKPYTAWKAAVFSLAERQNANISGDLANPAHDGIANLLKYALNLDPHSSATTGLPSTGTETLDGTVYLTFTYKVVPAATDLVYSVEVSPDLATWSSGNGATVIELVSNDAGGTTQTVRVRALDAGQRFARLRVSKKVSSANKLSGLNRRF